MHPKVVNFAFCDGCIRGVVKSTRIEVLVAASGMVEGGYYKPEELFILDK
jgi:prepilin-type processing-associated H-X9-DG protein